MMVCATEDVEYCTLSRTGIVWRVHVEEQIAISYCVITSEVVKQYASYA